jgi:hypothetical protein
VLAQLEVCALPEERIVKMKAIDPAHSAGLQTTTCVAAFAVANRDHNYSTVGRFSSRFR